MQEAWLVKNFLSEFAEGAYGKGNSEPIEVALKKFCEKNWVELDDGQREYLVKTLQLLAFEFGFLSIILEDDNIEEVAVIGLHKPVYVFDRAFGWMKTNAFYSSEAAVKNAANKMARQIGRHLSLQNPKLNAVLPNGSRLNACIEPAAMQPAITIRKFREKPFTPTELVANRTISSEAIAFLWAAMQTDCSMLVCGNTGSGKTSTLNALFCFVPKEERIIVTEETPEINLPHEHMVKLVTVQNIGIGMSELIENTLRMRPDRVVVGEIRNREEVNAFIDTLLAGQGKGCYATFHARSAKEAALRMKKLGVMEMDLGAVDIILVQKRWNSVREKKVSAEGPFSQTFSQKVSAEVRRITEIVEVSHSAEGLELRTLFEFDHEKGMLVRKNRSSKVMEKMKITFGLNEKQLGKLLKQREKRLRLLQAKEPSLKEFFEEISNEPD
ncbi:MAG: archaeal flagellar protein FlaI [archaeon GW2011_AR10]|nr:MAG: archaeal flagellar protein FlaI [archaeon GW2011_AR10]